MSKQRIGGQVCSDWPIAAGALLVLRTLVSRRCVELQLPPGESVTPLDTHF